MKTPFNQYDVSEIKKKKPALKNIDFLVLKNSGVALLIGTDHEDVLLRRDFHQGQQGEPKAVKTVLGWFSWKVTR